MFTATLRCGTVLSYEARGFRPDPGDRVPCRHHGYCAVQGIGGGGSGGVSAPRARSRGHVELVELLRGQSETTVHALRRQGITLRVVAAAQRAGLVELDLPAGRVAVRAALEATGSGMDLPPADGSRGAPRVPPCSAVAPEHQGLVDGQ